MKTFALKKIAQSLALVSVAAFGSSVYAASTWNFSTCNGTAANQTGAGTFGNSWSCAGTVSGNKVTVTAWGGADATGSTGFQTANVSAQGGSGFGIASQYEKIGVSAPDHSADNIPTNNTPDMFVLKFDTAVALDKVTLGWNKSDADFTLMAYKGTTPTISGKIAAYSGSTGLTTGGTTSGWALVEQVGDKAPDAATSQTSTDVVRTVNAANVVSSWWLISAYNSGFSNAAALDTTADYFKLFSVASKTVTTPPGNQVPEPGSLALMGIAMAGFVATRRRKQKAA